MVGEVPELAISCSEIIGKDGVKTMNEKKKRIEKGDKCQGRGEESYQ